MPKCLFEKATGLYTDGSRFDDIPHDSGTHVQLTLASFPDRRAERWDGALGVRPATAQETADYDAARKRSEAEGALATPFRLALRDVLLDMEQRLRAAGKTSGIQTIADAATPAEYTAALEGLLQSKL